MVSRSDIARMIQENIDSARVAGYESHAQHEEKRLEEFRRENAQQLEQEAQSGTPQESQPST